MTILFTIVYIHSLSHPRDFKATQFSHSQYRPNPIAISTTMGRVTYEQLRRRAAKGYAFNLEPLGTAVPIERITELLQEKIATTISDLENGPDPAQYRRIEKVYIGKTYISTKKEEPRPHTEITFEPHDPDTWKVDGISSRYNAHSRKDYGRDGMVVLCAIVSMRQ